MILDGKRNDIGSTAAAYSRAYLSTSGPNDHELNTSQASVAEQGSKKSNNAEHENCKPNNPEQYAQDQTSHKTDNSGQYSQEQAKAFSLPMPSQSTVIWAATGSSLSWNCAKPTARHLRLCRTSNPSAGICGFGADRRPLGLQSHGRSDRILGPRSDRLIRYQLSGCRGGATW